MRDYDSTVARIAGNLLSGRSSWEVTSSSFQVQLVREAVEVARAIVAETKRTEPADARVPKK